MYLKKKKDLVIPADFDSVQRERGGKKVDHCCIIESAGLNLARFFEDLTVTRTVSKNFFDFNLIKNARVTSVSFV